MTGVSWHVMQYCFIILQPPVGHSTPLREVLVQREWKKRAYDSVPAAAIQSLAAPLTPTFDGTLH